DESNTFPLEYAPKDDRCLRVVVREQSPCRDRHLSAQALNCLCEFHTQGTAADHDQRLWQVRAVKDVVVREVWRRIQSCDRWRHRPGSGAHEITARADGPVTDTQRAIALEGRLSK